MYVFGIEVRKQGPQLVFKVTLREQRAIRVRRCGKAVKHGNALGPQNIEELTQRGVLAADLREVL
jgi:hypothetical protein